MGLSFNKNISILMKQVVQNVIKTTPNINLNSIHNIFINDDEINIKIYLINEEILDIYNMLHGLQHDIYWHLFTKFNIKLKINITM